MIKKGLVKIVSLCVAILCLATLTNCKDSKKQQKPFNKHRILGTPQAAYLDEISGIIPSHKHEGLFWVHNDGRTPKDPVELYLVDDQMKVIQKVIVKTASYYETSTDATGTQHQEKYIDTVFNVDSEGITMTQKNGKPYIVLGDIGDNQAVRKNIVLYRFEEPSFKTPTDQPLDVAAEKMILQYAEGARDAEALLTDPITGDIVILTKRYPKPMVYAFPFEAKKVTIHQKGKINFNFKKALSKKKKKKNKYRYQITGGDINDDGDILVKTYGGVFLYKNPQKRSAVACLLTVKPLSLNYVVESQGEALCWGLNKQSYYTISEWRKKNPQPLHQYY